MANANAANRTDARAASTASVSLCSVCVYVCPWRRPNLALFLSRLGGLRWSIRDWRSDVVDCDKNTTTGEEERSKSRIGGGLIVKLTRREQANTTPPDKVPWHRPTGGSERDVPSTRHFLATNSSRPTGNSGCWGTPHRRLTRSCAQKSG